MTSIKVFIFSIGVLFFYQSNLYAQPSRFAYQATWIVTAFGIDWPYKTVNPEEQKKALAAIFKTLHRKKFNVVFFQVRVRADLIFPSSYEPFHEYLTGTYGKEPSYDIVNFAISLARTYGIEFHAWFNTMILRGKSSTKKSVGVPSLWSRHPEWIDRRAQKTPNQHTAFLNPGKPEVRRHLINLIVDFAKRYDIDGIQLGDYLRYPSKDFLDDVEFEKYNPRNMSREDWRRENINELVESLYDTLMKEKPYLRLGVSPIGVYLRQDDQPAMESYSEVYQDSREWTRRKKCDYLAPQVYFYIGPTTEKDKKRRKFNPAFEKLVQDWGKNKNDRHVLAGIGMYKPRIKKEWMKQVDLCQFFGLDGVSFYPYNQIKDIETPFVARKLVPPMLWKKSTPPDPPSDGRVVPTQDSIHISWQPSKDAFWTNVYKKSYSLTHPFVQNVYGTRVFIKRLSFKEEDFFLTSVDRYGNESRFYHVSSK